MNEPPHDGWAGKNCPQCGQGWHWRKWNKYKKEKKEIAPPRKGVLVGKEVGKGGANFLFLKQIASSKGVFQIPAIVDIDRPIFYFELLHRHEFPAYRTHRIC